MAQRGGEIALINEAGWTLIPLSASLSPIPSFSGSESFPPRDRLSTAR